MAHAHATIAFPVGGNSRSRICRRRADPRQFGRALRRHSVAAEERRWGWSDDAKLFAATFAGGFLFVSIMIA